MSYIDELTEYGLSRQEATIYYELLKNGSMTGYEVAKETGISKSNVYVALNGLTQKGAANLECGAANKYYPVDIEEFCNGKIRDLTSIKEILIKNQPKVLSKREGYINIQSEKNINNKICAMLEMCNQRLYILAHDWVLEKYTKELRRLISEGKKVVIITDDDFTLDGAIIYNTNVEEGQLRFIVDSEYVLTGELTGSDEDTCLYSGQANLVEVMKEALKNKILLIEKERLSK